MTKTKCLVIADDHPLFTLGLQAVLRPYYEIVGVIHNGAAVPEVVRELKPDLLLLDLSMPHVSGMPLVRATKIASPRTLILIVNGTATPELASLSLHNGADGIIVKTVTAEQLLSAVREVLNGGTCVRLATTSGGEREGPRNPALSRLTPRLREALALIGRGLTARQISYRLGISPRTAEFYRSELRARLQADTPAELYRVALAYAESGDIP